MNQRSASLFVCIPLLCLQQGALAQGFNPIAINWPVPEGGGVTNEDDPLGFWFTDGGNPVNNHQFWETVDMNGDARPDLVVTGQRSGGFPYVFGGYWRVHLNNGDGFDAVPTEWSLPEGGDNPGGYWDTEYSSTSNGFNTWTLMDMDGDHWPDLVVTAIAGNGSPRAFSPSNAPYWKVYLNTGSGFATAPLTWPLPAGGIVFGADVQSFPYVRYVSAPAGCHAWDTRDMNGDGRPDLVLTAYEQASFDAGTDPHWKVYLNTGTGFSLVAVDHQLPPGGGFYAGAPSGFPRMDSENYAPGSDVWRLRDMDADGRPDLVLTSAYDGSYFTCYGWGDMPFWKVYLNSGSAFSTTAIEWSVPEGGSSGIQQLGFHDVQQVFANQDNQQSWGLIDLGGDGPPDLVVASDDNDGSGAIMFGGDAPFWRRFTNTGDGFETTYTPWTLPDGGAVYPDSGFAQIECSNATNYGGEVWRTMDMNGDSLQDLVVTGHLPQDMAYENVFGLGTDPYWRVYLQIDPSSGVADHAGAALGLYPNPVSSTLIVKAPVALVGNPVLILDATGRIVLASFLRSTLEEFDLASLAAGPYMVRCGTSVSWVVKR
jgi:hypothetical protein